MASLSEIPVHLLPAFLCLSFLSLAIPITFLGPCCAEQSTVSGWMLNEWSHPGDAVCCSSSLHFMGNAKWLLCTPACKHTVLQTVPWKALLMPSLPEDDALESSCIKRKISHSFTRFYPTSKHCCKPVEGYSFRDVRNFSSCSVLNYILGRHGYLLVPHGLSTWVADDNGLVRSWESTDFALLMTTIKHNE